MGYITSMNDGPFDVRREMDFREAQVVRRYYLPPFPPKYSTADFHIK
jgi:hypothetical protein